MGQDKIKDTKAATPVGNGMTIFVPTSLCGEYIKEPNTRQQVTSESTHKEKHISTQVVYSIDQRGALSIPALQCSHGKPICILLLSI